jgi:hypothetical protein
LHSPIEHDLTGHHRWEVPVLRSSQEVVATRASLRDEMASGDLGDARLNARRNRLVTILEAHPDRGFPEACGDDSEAEALYRFLRNARVSLAGIIEPHLRATSERCQAVGQVLVIHDTTEHNFTGQKVRTGLTVLGPQRQGFWMHAALAVSADGMRAPLGVLAVAPFVRKHRGEAGPPQPWRQRFHAPEKHSRRWMDGVAEARTRLGPQVGAIHVMDREGDSYELFADLVQHGDAFVIRTHYDRRIVGSDSGATDTLHGAIPQTTFLCERTVALAPRPDIHRPAAATRRHPPREGRSATLRFAARPVVLQRPDQYGGRAPATVALNMIYVWEINPPPGEAPIEWRLLTTAPIATVTQVLQVVDWYQTRWLIEEFFKGLKTGCAYEQRQLESLDTLLVALGLFLPIAWQLLLLRHLARDMPEAPARVVLTSRQLQILHAASHGRLPAVPTVADAMQVIARLGGHLRHNKEPGWLVLSRGMQTLRAMEAGWLAAGDRRTK